MGHKVQVSFTDKQWNLIKKIRGTMGKTDADTIRNVVVSWLAEKSIISTDVKDEIAKKRGE